MQRASPKDVSHIALPDEVRTSKRYYFTFRNYQGIAHHLQKKNWERKNGIKEKEKK